MILADTPARYEVEVEDLDYLDLPEGPLLARVFRPVGEGPFPAVVDVHGGAWTQGDRTGNDAINVPLAARGIVVVSIDYRLPPQGTYPCSVQDVNYAVRWLKANAQRFATRPERVGVIGTSSGGHLAVLAAIKPREQRYAALPMAGDFDARVACCVAMWPVICPYTRYRDVVLARSEEPPSDRAGAGTKQMDYWLTQEAMQDGSPLLALTRGDAVVLPPMLYVQNPTDRLHPLASAQDFAKTYSARGGELQMHLVHGEQYNLVRTQPETPEARKALERMAAFIHSKCVGQS